MVNFQDKINFVYQKTKDYPHNGKYFFEHLINTSNIIRKIFPEKQYLIDAGLFHSIYGTCYYKFEQEIPREKIKFLIGEKSENLVYIFCTLENRTFEILKNKFDKDVQEDLYILEYANYLEQNADEEIITKIKNILYEQFSIKLPHLKKYNSFFSYH